MTIHNTYDIISVNGNTTFSYFFYSYICVKIKHRYSQTHNLKTESLDATMQNNHIQLNYLKKMSFCFVGLV